MNVNIRLLKEEDAYTSVKWRNDPDVFKYTGNTYQNEITIESELNWIRKVITKDDEYRCAIVADGTYVGNIYLTNIGKDSAKYHIFIGDKNFWGKGVAYKASLLILEHGFENLRLKSITLRVNKENISAYHLYKKLGFAEIKSDDSWIDMEVLNKPVIP